MAKINHITIKDVTRYLETIAYLPELPTATEDSADLVSVNNTLYVKQVTNGVYSYGTIQAGGGNVPSGDGVPVIEIQVPMDGESGIIQIADDIMNHGAGGYPLSITEEQQTLLTSNPYSIIKLLFVDDASSSTDEMSTMFASAMTSETLRLYFPSMGQGIMTALITSMLECSPVIEVLMFDLESGTLV